MKALKFPDSLVLIFGMILAAQLVSYVWMLALMGFITVEAGFMGVAGLLGDWVSGTVGWITVVVGNLLAVAAMGRWIWVTHPRLRQRLTEQPVATIV